MIDSELNMLSLRHPRNSQVDGRSRMLDIPVGAQKTCLSKNIYLIQCIFIIFSQYLNLLLIWGRHKKNGGRTPSSDQRN